MCDLTPPECKFLHAFIGEEKYKEVIEFYNKHEGFEEINVLDILEKLRKNI